MRGAHQPDQAQGRGAGEAGGVRGQAGGDGHHCYGGEGGQDGHIEWRVEARQKMVNKVKKQNEDITQATVRDCMESGWGG